MLKRYQGKHFKHNNKSNCMRRIVILVLIFAIMASYVMSGVLSIFYDHEQLINEFTIAGTYTVQFDANEGNGVMPDQKIYMYINTPLNANLFEREDHLFSCWNTEPDGSGDDYEDEEIVYNLIAENSTIVLYAQWDEETNVAEVIGDKKYPTLQAAIDAVHANGVKTEIKLLKSVTETVTIASGKNIELDLNHKTLTGDPVSGANSKATIENSGTLIVKNGTLTKIATTPVAVINNNPHASLTIDGASVIAHGTTKAQAIYNNNASLEIKGNSYISSESSNRATITAISGATTTITGGTIVAINYNAISNTPISPSTRGGEITIGTEDGLLDITSPVIQAKGKAIDTQYASINFYDGILKGGNSTVGQNYILDKVSGCYPLAGTETIDGTPYNTLVLDPSNTVTFNPTGGTVSRPEKYVDTGDEVGELPIPTRTGYKFDGWYTLEEGGEQVTEQTIVNGDIDCYAHWIELKTVTFHVNGGTSSENIRYIDAGEEVGELPTATRSGYEFDGWYTDPNEGVKVDEHLVINSNTDLYAYWNKECRIIFDPNGGTVSERARDVYENSEVGALPTPTKSKNTFVGWFTERSGGTQINANTIISNDVKFYAHWTGVNVARIDDVYYSTLQSAIDDVPADNTETTIVFLDDIVENVDIDPGQNIVFDIGNYTLSNATNNAVLLNYGTIKIINGTITSSAGYATINNYEGSTVIITGGNVINTGPRQSVYNKGGYLEISGDAYLKSFNLATDKIRGTVHNLEGGTTTITGGTIIAEKENAIYNEKGTVIIGAKDGNVSTTSPIIQSQKIGIKNTSTLKFYDGIIQVPTNKTLLNGNVTETEDGYDFSNGTKIIDGVTYKTAYLDNSIRIPTPVLGLIYNRTLQTGVYPLESAYTITGNKATNAGTYTATASLKYPSTTTWEDGSTTDKTITYTISPATVTPVLEADDKVYDGTTTATGTITLTGIIKGDAGSVTATATLIEFATENAGIDIAVTATGITLSGNNASNYVLSSTTAEDTANINEDTSGGE